METDFRAQADWILVYLPAGLLSVQVDAAADDSTATSRYVGYFGTYAVPRGSARW